MTRTKRTCGIEGCNEPHRCKGFCAVHYEEWLRTDPDRARCSVEGCDTPARKRGLCGKHYQRFTTHGDATVTTRIRNNDHARWDSYIKVLPNGCWDWTGKCFPSGYARTTVGQSPRRAARVIYEWQVGPIPNGLTLDHECHNAAAARGECAGGIACPHRRCVNPDHLVPKPIGENQHASVNTPAGRTHCKWGDEFTEENTSWQRRKNGTMTRVCRACKRRRARERQDRVNPNRQRRPWRQF